MKLTLLQIGVVLVLGYIGATLFHSMTHPEMSDCVYFDHTGPYDRYQCSEGIQLRRIE